jgi:preprotein translocase subunit SecG
MPREVKWAISLLVGAILLWIGWKFYAVLLVVHILICLVLIGVILLQSGEAADLAGAFGGSGSQTAFGPRGATTFLSRATTWCAIMFMFTSLEMTVHISTRTVGPGGGSVLEQFSKPTPGAPARPAAPAAPGAPIVPPPPAGTAPAAPTAPAQSAPAPAAPAPVAPAAPAAPPAPGTK